MKALRFFGTDGIRGKAGAAPMNAETALGLGRAVGVWIQSPRAHSPLLAAPTAIVARDTRESGEFLEAALTSGLLAEGVNVFLAGCVPTPALAFLTRSLRADVGIMVSASHNPAEDNGIKFLHRHGLKLSEAEEEELENLLLETLRRPAERAFCGFGRKTHLEGAVQRYIEHAKASFPGTLTLSGFRIVLDCANGAASFTSPAILRELGAEVDVFHASPDGKNINFHCGSTHPEVLCELVLKTGAHIGISHDGDADRVVLADETGALLDGDDILAIAAQDMISRGKLNKNTVVATVMSNYGLDRCLEQLGGRLLRTPVGDRSVHDAMEANGLSLGGEQSGHIIFREFSTTGDGIVTALQILRIMAESGKPLSELRRCLAKFPQVQRNVAVREKPPIESLPSLQSLITSVETELAGRGRVLVRYSGTEPKLRLLLEGPDEAFLNDAASRIEAEIRRLLCP